mmetsp:Transcript_75000/g.149014  ORF Transcript_75000/g.149014 Transcript_75000/m.149014 type:complete len:92 (+) Transcript_75000:123-398(+)|eukprot:CAMPEP_0174719818 /NCGR_PEP_ID=MMETSP1094-20130205/32045_1 /TAXON_ID=156173 /ORGANISM="Chrysochromulina brevifilum, Strain UTEX LB 985" /LENGTH=91 /DNA_ID=CAMNT_0015920191 /DNA_START=123 /DNA_END=398 /DNA_ORIENTATION=-
MASVPQKMTKEEAEKKHGLMAEEYQELVEDFDGMDTDKSGYLEFDEVVKMMMKESGSSEEDASKLAKEQLAKMDTDSDGRITFNEYVAALC